jgi:hypothetical protein
MPPVSKTVGQPRRHLGAAHLSGPRRGGAARPPSPSQTGPAAKGRRRAAPPTTDAAHLSLTKLHWADELQASSLHAWEGRGDYQETDYNRAALCSPVPTQPATCERPATAWLLLLLLHSPLRCQHRHAAHHVRAAGDGVVIPCHCKSNMKFRCHKLV